MGPTNRLWRTRAVLLGRLIKSCIQPVSAFFTASSNGVRKAIIQSDGAIFVIAALFCFILFMINLMIKENKGRKPATAAMVVEYRAKNACLKDTIPKIVEQNKGAPLRTEQIWKASEDCAKAAADLAEKQAMEKALK